MAKVLIAWELGGGFGHLLPYQSLASYLHDNQHEVYYAARSLTRAQSVFPATHTGLFQSPLSTQNEGPIIDRPSSYAHILNNTGFNNSQGLAGRIRAWQSIYDSVKPDIVIFDHCPTGSAAAKPYNFYKIQCGTGFTLPVQSSPFQPLLKTNASTESLVEFENHLLGNLNEALGNVNCSPLEQLQELLSADGEILLTWEEFDCYSDRDAALYSGPAFPKNHGTPIKWSIGKQPKVFGYLKPFENLAHLTQTLDKQNIRTVIYAPEVSEDIRDKLAGNKIRFTDQPARLPESIRDCRFMINHGNLATVCSSLLAGIPLLLIPRNLEEYLTSRAVEEMGAGVAFIPNKHTDLQERIQRLLDNNTYAHKAKAFARKYKEAAFDQASHTIIETIKEML